MGRFAQVVIGAVLAPVAGCASNWLPAPAVPFRPVMRLYQLQAAILDGTLRAARTKMARGFAFEAWVTA